MHFQKAVAESRNEIEEQDQERLAAEGPAGWLSCPALSCPTSCRDILLIIDGRMYLWAWFMRRVACSAKRDQIAQLVGKGSDSENMEARYP